MIVLFGRCITESVFYISTRKREVVIIRRLEDDDMPYIICNNDNYLYRDNKNHFSIVHIMENATKWSDAQKADNVCTHCGEVKTMEVRHCDYLPDIMKKAIRKHNELYDDNVTEVETDFYGTISI